MQCKRCGIQLTANNIDDCPNCGPVKSARFPRILGTGLFLSPAIITSALTLTVMLLLGYSALISIGATSGVLILGGLLSFFVLTDMS